jgi:hypothetical protein
MASSETAFFREILALASAGHMVSVMQALRLKRNWLHTRAPQAPVHEPYGRVLLHRDQRGEVMLAGWQAGRRCAPHDHDDARGIVVVASGAFTETRYRHRAGSLTAVGTSTASVGDVLAVTSGLIHDLHCNAAGATLHVYVPAIERMRVYDVVTRTTLIVAEDCGAWLPRDAKHVIDTETWDTSHDAKPIG